MNHNLRKIVIITGTTCTKKSYLAVDICRKINGEVINSDPSQFYRDFNIGVAKLDQAEMQNIPHHMMSFLNSDQSYNVADFVRKTDDIIAEIINRNKLPVIVGASGLYIYWLIYPMINVPARNPLFAKKYKNYSNTDLYQELIKVDPEGSRTCHYANRRRVLRNLEIYETLKQTKTELIQNTIHTRKYDYLLIELQNKSSNYEKLLRERIKLQIKNGFIEEVRKIEENTLNIGSKIKNIMGYQEVLNYIKGQNKQIINLETQIFTKTKQIIKKQRTFYQNKIINKYIFDVSSFTEAKNKIDKLIKCFLTS